MVRPVLSVEFALGSTGPGVSSYLRLDDPDKGKLDQNWLAPNASPTPPSPNWFTLDDSLHGRLDQAMLPGDSLGAGWWIDVSSQVMRLSVRRGRRRLLDDYQTGTATLTLKNDDLRFDPFNLAGPYAAAGASNLRPMLPCRVAATYAGTRYPLFYGYVDRWAPEYSEPGTGICTVTVSDGFKQLANYDPSALASPVGAGELSGARIHRILDNAGWPTSDRRIDAGDTVLQGTTLAANTLSELKLTAATERGDLLIDTDGALLFRERHARNERSESINVQAVFGDGTGEIECSNIEQPVDDELIRNEANVARVGGASQTAGSDISQATYLKRSWTRTDLIHTTDAESLEYARWIIRQFAQQEKRIEQITLEPDGFDGTPDPWSHVVGRAIGDRVTVNRRPLNGTMFSADCWIEGILHDISPIEAGGKWVTKFDLSDASRSSALVLDHASLGQLDQNVLAY